VVGSQDDFPDALLTVELERLLASNVFRRSPQQSRLLKYLVEQVRAGRGDRLKESTVAVAVLGRDASSFDSRSDTAVRVTARRMRQRLARYYATEGAWAAVEIVVPVGRYVPVFQRRAHNGGVKLPSIAVLPLLNFTGDPGIGAFCDSLAEEITDVLAHVPGVKVIARTSAFRFRDGLTDVRAIGQALGVSTLLEGSVQAGPDGQAKVVLQWVRSTDGFHAWSCSMEASPGESEAVFRERVAREVVTGLQRRMRETGPVHGAPSVARGARRSHNGQAQELYDAGRYLLRTETIDGYRRAIDKLRQATVADPEFALAHCALGRALVSLVGVTVAPANGLLTGARQALARALALDPDLGEAHALSGFIGCAFDRDWTRAELSHLRGIHSAPSLPYAHSAYAWGLMVNRRFADADAEFRFARELDPLDLKVRAHQALSALYAGDDEGAVAQFNAILTVEPAHIVARVLLATAYLWRGDTDRAELLFAALVHAHPGLSIGEVGLAQVDAEKGRVQSARGRLDRLKSGRRVHLPPYQVAMIHARLGEASAALSWLKRAALQNDMNFVCAPIDRSFARLHADPRFGKLLARFGLTNH
jgi:adenylate cyclase